jgi:hypothetical protein
MVLADGRVPDRVRGEGSLPLCWLRARLLVAADGLPRLGGDAQDDRRHRDRYERVRDLKAEPDECGTEDDSDADVSVRPGVRAIGDQGGAVESSASPRSDARSDAVSDDADESSKGESQEVMRRVGVDKSDDRHNGSHDRANEDRCDDGEAGCGLGATRSEKERGADGQCG